MTHAQPLLRLTKVCSLLLGLQIGASSVGAAQQCLPSEAVTSFGQWFVPAIVLSSSVPIQRIDPAIPGLIASSLKLQIGVRSGTGRKWNLVIRDLDYRVLVTFGPKDFTDSAGALRLIRWTGRLSAGIVRADLVTTQPTDISIEI